VPKRQKSLQLTNVNQLCLRLWRRGERRRRRFRLALTKHCFICRMFFRKNVATENFQLFQPKAADEVLILLPLITYTDFKIKPAAIE